MLRITHAPDLHFSEKYREEALKALRFILDTSRDRHVDAIFIPGDFFDGPISVGPLLNEIIALLELTPCKTYFIRGTPSHDTEGSVELLAKIHTVNVGAIACFTDRPISFPADVGGYFSFLPAPTKAFLAQGATGSPEDINQIMQAKLRAILADFGAQAAGGPRPHILVSHITVAGAETSTGQVLLGGDIQVSIADLALANADYVALGHIHKAQKLGENIYYAGSPFHLNFGELEPKGFNIVTFDDDGNLDDVEFIQTPSRPRQVIDAEIIDGRVVLSTLPNPDADVRVRIYGPASQFTDDLSQQVEDQCAHCMSIKVEKIPSAENHVRSANIMTAKSLRDKVMEYGQVKAIDIPESALLKVDHIEAEVVS
jgi:exonuclease SbcD